jgi:alanine racemase
MVEAHINLGALRHNTRVARQLAPNSKLMAMINANAYGHGMVAVARALQDQIDGFAVARWHEALTLREHGIESRLLVLSSLLSHTQCQQAASAGIDLVIHETSGAALLCQHTLPQALNVWLKVDTGMHRLGLAPTAAPGIFASLRSAPSVGDMVLMSHFASADDIDNPFSAMQLRRLDQVNESLNAPISIANSAAIISQPDSHRSWIRPGIMLYGANPLGDQSAPQLKPVMTLRSRLLAVRTIAPGDSVGYNQTWTSMRTTRIGTIAIGYGDGYPRHARLGTPVLINGRRVPLVGRVSMDTISVDLGPEAKDASNDEAILWGEGLAVNEIADCADTIAYQLLTGVTARARFIYTD